MSTGYGYDAAGETTQVTDGAGNLTRFCFDALGRQTATVNPDGTSSTVTYDPAGNQLGQASLDAARADPGQHERDLQRRGPAAVDHRRARLLHAPTPTTPPGA